MAPFGTRILLCLVACGSAAGQSTFSQSDSVSPVSISVRELEALLNSINEHALEQNNRADDRALLQSAIDEAEREIAKHSQVSDGESDTPWELRERLLTARFALKTFELRRHAVLVRVGDNKTSIAISEAEIDQITLKRIPRNPTFLSFSYQCSNSAGPGPCNINSIDLWLRAEWNSLETTGSSRAHVSDTAAFIIDAISTHETWVGGRGWSLAAWFGIWLLFLLVLPAAALAFNLRAPLRSALIASSLVLALAAPFFFGLVVLPAFETAESAIAKWSPEIGLASLLLTLVGLTAGLISRPNHQQGTVAKNSKTRTTSSDETIL